MLGFLPNWARQQASAHLDSLMFFDPVQFLPYEIVGLILAHMSPKDLLSASSVNREWRERTQDEELWRACFRREGWHMDIPKVREFERKAKDKAARLAKSNSANGMLQRKDSRKRRAGEAFSDVEAARTPVANGSPSADSSLEDTYSDAMEGVEAMSDASTAGTLGSHAVQRTGSRWQTAEAGGSPDSAFHSDPTDFKLAPSVLQGNARREDTSDPRVSWAYLYKQRRLLERNWDTGRYKQLRLPHLDHPEEGHEECVYTIQHTGDYLVSGSRDRTIRIWDLNTERLRKGGQPILRGHKASVLCLQFDPTPENDIIVSGGSDSLVIIWKFSTGEVIRMMADAHFESVLNLRFDDRYIVTCSKDKTIKIWNRREITRDSPIIPRHVLNSFNCDPTLTDPIAEHSLLTTLIGHHAAVNAVMIHNDTIVSASGDRTIRSWNIHSGKAEKTYIGHTKGIACVQYDGRRIISGSSDNTVRIFDAENQAEVACLHGHSNLVRTLQARFGDLETVTDEELQAESRKADIAFYKALHGGMTPASSARTGRRNAGSSKPEDMLAVGTKIPPGGGGSKWAKIVSGSYDETIIMWKKDKDGKWVQRVRLHQDLLQNRHRRPRQQLPPAANAAGGHPGPAQGGHPTAPAQQAIAQVQGAAAGLNDLIAQQHAVPAPSQIQQFISQQPNTLQANLNTLQQALQQAQSTGTTQQTSSTHQATTHVAAQQQPAAQAGPALHPTVQAVQAATPAQATHGQAQQQQAAQHRDSSNRVFKLQFDARRIMCCSQNQVIVGWDFANGDPELQRIGSWSLETY